jgi:hypothetical protein
VIRFGIVAGAMHNQYAFKGDNTLLVDNKYTGNVSPILGVMMDIALSRNLNRWHIVNELIYKNYKTGSTFTRPFGMGYSRTNVVEFNLSYIQLNTLVRYIFKPLAVISPYVNVGISNAVMVSESANSLHTTYSYGSQETTKAIEGIRKYEFTPIVIGAGLNMKKYLAEIRYCYNKRGFSPQITLEVNPHAYQFIFAYKFK